MKRPSPAWLENAVFYEIYPQSFFDSNSDGIGDIPGITKKLDYLEYLGCNVLWLNPCFESPFGDAGYDISDFRKVAARYGTNADIRTLFEEAHKRGMKVCLDLVAGHTSVEHPWFRESAKVGKNPYTNWYIWTDNVWTDPGDNLKAIQGCSDRDGAYVTNFFPFQPALNFGFAQPDPAKPWQLPVDHPDVQAVRREMMDIMRFWLDQGADGFRVDMASSLVKNDPEHRETMAFWREIREIYDREYPEAALIAEWSLPSQAITAGFHIDFMIHFGTRAYTSLFRYESSRDAFRTGVFCGDGPLHGFSFFDRAGQGDINDFLNPYLQHYQATRDLGYISLPSGNHDIVRLAAGRTEAELKVAFAFLLTMPGVPCIYYGDEIGMRHSHGLASKEGGFGRTGARTPMQWTPGKNAGFSTAAASQLYLPLDAAENRPDVESQTNDPQSLLHFVRSLIRLRQENKALGPSGSFTPVFSKGGGYPFVYLREHENQRVLVALNPSAKPAAATIPKAVAGEPGALLVGESPRLTVSDAFYEIELSGVSCAILKMRT